MNDFSTSRKIAFIHLSANGDEKAEIFEEVGVVKKVQFYNKDVIKKKRENIRSVVKGYKILNFRQVKLMVKKKLVGITV